MLTNNQIRFVKTLQQRKFREEHALFVVEGVKMVSELFASNWQVHSLYYNDEFDVTTVPSTVREGFRVSNKDLSRISGLKTPNQVVAVVHQQRAEIAPEDLASTLCLALDDVRDPGNLGTIIRLADWFGIPHILCSAQSVEVYNPKVVQSTMGSLFRVGVHKVDLPAFLTHSKTAVELPILGAVLGGSNIYELDLPAAGILVMGSESHGIAEENLSALTHRISIPSYGKAESLNVSTATAVLLAEFKRRQH